MTWWGVLIVAVAQGVWTVLCIIMGISFRERFELQERIKWQVPDQDSE